MEYLEKFKFRKIFKTHYFNSYLSTDITENITNHGEKIQIRKTEDIMVVDVILVLCFIMHLYQN